MANSVCVDSSFMLHVIRGDTSAPACLHWSEWKRELRPVLAPLLLCYELANALRQYVRARVMTHSDAVDTIRDVLHLGIELRTDLSLHVDALEMADRLGLAATYDAHYLVLAEQVGADFWTADERLFEHVKGHLPWVHLLERS